MAQLKKGTVAGRHKTGTKQAQLLSAETSALASGLLHAGYLPCAVAGNVNQVVQEEMPYAFCSAGAQLPFSLQTG